VTTRNNIISIPYQYLLLSENIHKYSKGILKSLLGHIKTRGIVISISEGEITSMIEDLIKRKEKNTNNCPTRGWNRPPLRNRTSSRIARELVHSRGGRPWPPAAHSCCHQKANPMATCFARTGFGQGSRRIESSFGVCCILNLHKHSRPGGSTADRWAVR